LDLSESFVRRKQWGYGLGADYGISKLCVTSYALELSQRLQVNLPSSLPSLSLWVE